MPAVKVELCCSAFGYQSPHTLSELHCSGMLPSLPYLRWNMETNCTKQQAKGQDDFVK